MATTIPRVIGTPTTIKGTSTIPSPLIGTVIAVLDNGFGSGYQWSVVVIDVKYNAKDEPTSATVSPVLAITDNTVTYDRRNQQKIKVYTKGGYSSWNLASQDRMLHYLAFDAYVPSENVLRGLK